MKLMSLFLCCYGDFSHYSLRALHSLINEKEFKEHRDLHVGCNSCCPQTIAALRKQFDRGLIDTLLESNPNLNKSPMMRLALDVTETPYFLVMDDDSHLRAGWLPAFLNFIQENSPFDAAGSICVMHRYESPLEAKYEVNKEPAQTIQRQVWESGKGGVL